MSIFAELKRRNVFRVGIAYVVVGWLLLQVAEIIVPALHLPDWVLTLTLYLLMLGFLPAVIFAWAFEMTPEGLKKEKEVDRAQSITNKTGRKLDFTIIGLLAVAVIYLVLDKFSVDPEPVETEAGAEVVEATGPPARSIAVLPFSNMSDDASNEYFSDGISEEILNALAHIKDLKVAGRTSSFAFKGRNEDLRLIGETLNVSHILEGSVRKAGNTVRITAQLIQVSDGFHLWSETYDRELIDVFAIQDEIAAAILAELKAELLADEQVAATRTDPRAYEKYLQARQLMYTRSQPEIEAAVHLLDESMALDPAFAPAWAQRGIAAKLLSVTQYGTTPFLDSQAQIKRYAEHALELDPELAEGWAALGLYHSREPGPESHKLALEQLERALTINPSMIDASNWLYGELAEDNQAMRALQVLEDMFERDPLYPPLIGNMALQYNRLGKKEAFGDALERLRPFRKGTPNFEMGEAIHLASIGDLAGSFPVAKRSVSKMPNSAFAAGALSRTLYGLNEFEQVAAIPRTSSPMFKLRALLVLGREEESTMFARQALEQRRDPSLMIEFLSYTGQHETLITLVQERWGGLDGFEAEVSPLPGFGHGDMINIARSCRAIGRMVCFEQAMTLVRSNHDRQIEAGIAWGQFYLMEGLYWTLADDHDRAISFLAKAVDDHMLLNPRMSRLFPILAELEGDSRFEELQERIRAHVNDQRSRLGLEPLGPVYSS
jgi:TolB-like protein